MNLRGGKWGWRKNFKEKKKKYVLSFFIFIKGFYRGSFILFKKTSMTFNLFQALLYIIIYSFHILTQVIHIVLLCSTCCQHPCLMCKKINHAILKELLRWLSWYNGASSTDLAPEPVFLLLMQSPEVQSIKGKWKNYSKMLKIALLLTFVHMPMPTKWIYDYIYI